MGVWREIVVAVCLVGGTALTMAAALAMRRFPDLLSRLHAPAKPQVLGLVLMLTGMAVALGDPRVAWTCVLVLLFQLITAPIGAHMAARAGYRTGKVDSERLYVDEYRRDLAESHRATEPPPQDGS